VAQPYAGQQWRMAGAKSLEKVVQSLFLARSEAETPDGPDVADDLRKLVW
jgi:hypothetical protein